MKEVLLLSPICRWGHQGTERVAQGNQLMEEGKKKEGQELLDQGFLSLFRSHKSLPKNKPLIKFLSEDGIKSGLQNTENTYMENNNRRMPEAIEPLFFVVTKSTFSFLQSSIPS